MALSFPRRQTAVNDGEREACMLLLINVDSRTAIRRACHYELVRAGRRGEGTPALVRSGFVMGTEW